MKRLLIFFLAIILAFSLFSCNRNTVKYKCHEITIRLPEEFSNYEVDGYTMGFESEKVSIAGLREDYKTYPELASTTLEQYSSFILDNNSNRGMKRSEYFGEMASAEHTYLNTENNQNYKYFSVMLKTHEAFWLIQFSCVESDYETLKPQFIEWAKTIRY